MQDFVEWRTNPCHLRAEEYFDENVSLNDRDIGRPRESANRVQKFKATLWLCDTYPLSLAEQVSRIEEERWLKMQMRDIDAGVRERHGAASRAGGIVLGTRGTSGVLNHQRQAP